MALAGVLLTAGALAVLETALAAARPAGDRVRSALLAGVQALMALGLLGLAVTANPQPWVLLLLAGVALAFLFAVADTALRKRTEP
jgi:hypothetical protein